MESTHPSTGTTTALAFESRMADTTAKLLGRNGINVMSAPSMQEVPLDQHEALFTFGKKLLAGAVDILICTTGVGTRMMIDTLKTEHPLPDILDALSGIIIISRGPKPAGVLRKFKIPIDIKVPEPNTCKKILAAIDSHDLTSSLKGKTVAIQEYGQTNKALNDGIRDREATLCRLPIYRWTLPDDLQPLKEGIRAVTNNEVQVVLFTSKTQINHAMKVAEHIDLKDDFRNALNDAFVASIGPVCSKGIESHGVKVDFEPSRPKLAIFINELTEQLA